MVSSPHLFCMGFPKGMTYLLDKLNGWKQVQTKIYEVPFNAFTFVFFLLQDEHVVVKELLQFLICQIDAQLLKCVKL